MRVQALTLGFAGLVVVVGACGSGDSVKPATSCTGANCGAGATGGNAGSGGSGGSSGGSAGRGGTGGSSGTTTGGGGAGGSGNDTGEAGADAAGTGGSTGGTSGGSAGSSASGNGGSGGSAGTSGGSGLTFSVLRAGLLDGNSTAWEMARDVVFDDQGSMYVVGGTSSPDFPVTSGAYDTSYNTGGNELGTQGDTDGFITKFDADGKVVWSTYLGGPNYDRIYGVEVDASHDVYVAGRAGRGFPTTSGALQTAFAGDSAPNGPYGSQDGFVSKLSADGSTLIWSTYFGESGPGFIRDIDIDSQKRIYVVASSINGSDMDQYVTSGAAQSTRRGDYDSFFARISADGSAVEYGTYLGGNDSNGYYSSNPSVRVLPDGTAFALFVEPGAGAPTTSGAFQRSSGGGSDLLLAKFSPSGSMVFCTYLGGSGDEGMDTHSLAIDKDGNAVIAAGSNSTDYPVTDSSPHASAADLVVTIVAPDGASMLSSTQLGGDKADSAEGVDIGPGGDIYITGSTNSSDLPVTPGALVSSHIGSREGFLVVMSADLSQRKYVSYDGIPGEYANRSTAVNSEGLWGVVGAVWNLDPFPSTGSYDKQINGQHAAFFRVLAAQ